MKINHINLILVLIAFLSCNRGNIKPLPQVIEANSLSLKDSLKNKISLQLKECLPYNWEMWEEYSEELKTHLNHIGKGEFDLHFKALYQVTDTVFEDDVNGKKGDKYYPEIILHFYKWDKSIKESVQFTRDNWQMISDVHPMYDFAETKHYLIYGGYNEDQKFQPKDIKSEELKICLKGKIIVDE